MAVISLFFLFFKKQRNHPQKLYIRKKFAILEISSPNFLCKLSAPKTPSTPILEPKFGHILNKLSLLVTYLSPFANFRGQSLGGKLQKSCPILKWGMSFVSRSKNTGNPIWSLCMVETTVKVWAFYLVKQKKLSNFEVRDKFFQGPKIFLRATLWRLHI